MATAQSTAVYLGEPAMHARYQSDSGLSYSHLCGLTYNTVIRMIRSRITVELAAPMTETPAWRV